MQIQTTELDRDSSKKQWGPVHSSLFRKIRRSLRESQAFENVRRVLVGVSGGADSAVLLHQLSALRDRGGPELFALHVHHGLRGKEADRDASVAENLARIHQCEFHIAHLRFGSGLIPSEHKLRHRRLETLEKMALKVSAERVALAHHRDDQAETILMRLLGGSDVRGLTGMRAFRPPLWVRPMLNVTRDEIEQEAHACDLPFIHDSSNFETYARRNYLRRIILPMIRSHFNPQIDRHLCDLSDSLFHVNDLLRSQAEVVLEKARMKGTRCSVAALRVCPVAVRRRALQMLYEEAAGDGSALRRPQLRQLEHLLMTDGEERMLSLPHGVRALRESGWILLAQRD